LAAAMTRAGAAAFGLKLFAPSCPAGAITTIHSADGVDSGAIVKDFRDRFGAIVANGQGEMKGKLFRIAHLGYYDYLDTVGILAALEQVIASVSGEQVEFGTAVRAAQEVYAQRHRDMANTVAIAG
jgi:aspartate aminotransferase-like enzyme